MIERPGRDRADQLLAPLLRLRAHVEEALELDHHLLVRLFRLTRHPVVEALLLHPGAHVLDVPVEELGVLLLLDDSARDVKLVFPRGEEARMQRVPERLHVVVPADDHVLLEPLELVLTLA